MIQTMYLFDLFHKLLPYILIKTKYPKTTVGTNFRCAPSFCIHSGQQSVKIGNHCSLVDGLINAGPTAAVTIEDYVFFGHGVKILARGHDHTYTNEQRQTIITGKPITIKEGAWIASGAIILAGVTVGQHAVVAAGSIVTKDVPAYTIVAGNPARIIKKIKPETR